MRILFLSIFVALFTFLSAALVVGTVEKANGSVKVKSAGSVKKSKVKDGFEIKKGDLITTSRKGSAVIKLSDGSTMVLDGSSSVHFTALNSADQQTGKVYYKVTSRNAKNALKIKTPFAIIGIKGTTFIVDTNKDTASVSLKEGLIGVQSIKEEFALYRKKLEEEYNKFIGDQEKEYEEFLKEGEEGVAQMTKEFDMHAGTSISFSGKKAKESGWTEDDEKELDYFESLISSDGVNIDEPDEEEIVEKPTEQVKETPAVVETAPISVKEESKEDVPDAFDEDDDWNDEDDAELDKIEAEFRR